MSEQTPPKPPTSAIPLCNMILGLLIIAQVPVMFGAISGAGTIWLAPWILCAYPVIVFCVIKMFRDGDMVEATINGVLSCVLMGQKRHIWTYLARIHTTRPNFLLLKYSPAWQ